MESDASSKIQLVVSLGRDRYEVDASGAMTWAEVIDSVAKQAGMDISALRLLYKGRAVGGEKTLADAAVKTGSKLMAMKTKAHHTGEQARERRQKAAADATAAELLRDRTQQAGSKAIAPGSAASSGKTKPLGDTIDEECGDFYVRASHGGKLYKLRIASDACVSDLKTRVAELIGISEKEQRLVYGGKRELPDTASIGGDLGAKRGAMFLVLARRGHHDAVEAKQDIGMLTNEVGTVGEKLASLERKVRGRLLSEYVEVTLAIGEVDAEIERLSGNVAAVRGIGAGEDKAEAENLSKYLQEMKKSIEALREHASAAFSGGG